VFRAALARLRALIRRDVIAGEIREELQIHVAMRAEDLERDGLSRQEARRQAARKFGNLALIQDRGYDVRGGGVMETIVQDLRYALRLFGAQRAFSLVAVLTLAIGVGLSTALFSVIHAVVIRPLPYPKPEQLVRVDVLDPGLRGGEALRLAPSLADVRAWREDQRVFRQVAVDRGEYELIVDTGEAERLTVQRVSEGFFDVFGVRPLQGRAFTMEDTRSGTPLVVMLGHSYWRTRFGADETVLGRQIRVAGEPATIVGVLPPGFYPLVSVWQPYPREVVPETLRGSGAPVVARLQPGLSREQAEKNLSQMVGVSDLAGGRARATGVRIESLYAEAVAGTGPMVGTLSGAVAAILLIACVNVAGLLLARGAARQRELAIRASIGAGRVRMIRQLLTESLVLALAGGLAGVVLAWVTLDAIVAIVPLSLPQSAPVSLNIDVLIFAAIVAVSTAVLFGLVPAVRLSRVPVTTVLAGADRRSGAALPRRSGQWLIAIEVALGVVLLAGASLMIRSFARLVSVDLGFEPGSFLTLHVSPLDPSPAVAAEYYPALVAAIRRFPDVEAVGAGNQLPIGGSRRAGFVKLPDRPPIRIDERSVLPGFFEAIGLPLKQGRFFADADLAAGRPLVVINEMAARQIFGNVPPVGRLLPQDENPPEIVGVSGDFLQDGARSPVRANVYFVRAGGESTSRQPYIVFVRPRGASLTLPGRLRAAAHAIGPRVVVEGIRSGEDFVSDSVTVPRRRMVLLSLLGGVGLLLTMVGVFSMTAYAVARRTREIGVRMAFGADKGDVVRAMVRDAIWPVTLGLAAGACGAYFGTRVIATLLFQTTPHDPVALSSALGMLGVSAVVAAWIPARRAALVDPVSALRAD
jgi:putative ABC transport system permease protein